jgi:hypothetical protein
MILKTMTGPQKKPTFDHLGFMYTISFGDMQGWLMQYEAVSVHIWTSVPLMASCKSKSWNSS